MMDKQKFVDILSSQLYGFSIDTVENCVYVAGILYNAGYRKPTENEVVLTKEQFKSFCFVKQLFGGKDETITAGELARALQIHRKQIRKETAEKFAERLKDWLRNHPIKFEHYKSGGFGYYDRKIDEKVIDEIYKEITGGNNRETSDLQCVSCGKYAGEGRQICVNCENKSDRGGD